MRLFQIICIILIFSTCKRKNIEIIYSNEIQISTETDIDPGHRLNVKFYNWETPSIVAYSDVDYSLHFFDYKTKLEYKTINLDNLPNKKEVRAFQFINENYIVISTQLNFQYYIINLEGKVETSFNLKPKELKNFGNIAYGNFNDGANSIPIINLKNKNQLIVFQSYFAPYEYLKQYSSFYILEYQLEDSISINLIDEIKFSNLDKIKDKTPYSFYPRIANDENSCYIGYSSS